VQRVPTRCFAQPDKELCAAQPPRKEADSIADEVRNWPGLIEYASESEVPSQVTEPIYQLPVYEDGLMC
jgi:hypothetical protein